MSEAELPFVVTMPHFGILFQPLIPNGEGQCTANENLAQCLGLYFMPTLEKALKSLRSSLHGRVATV
jgi:hypothetical protein